MPVGSEPDRLLEDTSRLTMPVGRAGSTPSTPLLLMFRYLWHVDRGAAGHGCGRVASQPGIDGNPCADLTGAAT
jgi:hypothetical protein